MQFKFHDLLSESLKAYIGRDFFPDPISFFHVRVILKTKSHHEIMLTHVGGSIMIPRVLNGGGGGASPYGGGGSSAKTAASHV